jgi:exonuclease III
MILSPTQRKIKGGTAILFKQNLNVEIIEILKEQQENFICIHCKINNYEIVLGAIYGPNATDRTFYSALERFLQRKTGVPIVLGGDWNTTWDNSTPATNPDIINMCNTPNQANGRLLNQLSINHNLCDPYRVLNPDLIDFTYVPFGPTRINRSRLDFFVVSSNILQQIESCEIRKSTLGKHFDHKPVFLKFKSAIQVPRNNSLRSSFLDDNAVTMSAELSALQVYNRYINFAGLHDLAVQMPQTISRLKEIFLNYMETDKKKSDLQTLNEIEHRLSEIFDDFNRERGFLPNLEYFSELPTICTKKEFFTELTAFFSEKVAKTQYNLKSKTKTFFKKIWKRKSPDWVRITQRTNLKFSN